jgi:hypothetical protein
MIITRLSGGLGNQFFQYALGRRLSMDRGVPLYFDLSALQAKKSYRKYELDHFQIKGNPATEEEIKKFHENSEINFLHKLSSLFRGQLSYFQQKNVIEQSPCFDPNILKVYSHVSLYGYWQSEKYFFDIRPVLLSELKIKERLDDENQKMLDKIQKTNSVSLHIRRGDYVNDSRTNQVHGVLPLDYYRQAMQVIEKNIDSPHYYLFSDDISWARQNMNDMKNITFVDHNDPEYARFDLELMRACKYHITANSSFSWWAAWLNDYSHKLVIAPKKWFADASRDNHDLIPSTWMVI